MKILIALLLAASPLFSKCPRHGGYDKNSNLEFEGICNDIDVVNARIGKGTTTNDNASAGYIGESISSLVGPVSVTTTAQFGDITSIVLTGGDWDVTGIAVYNRNGATWNDTALGISSTAGNSSGGLVYGSTYVDYIFTAAANPTYFTMAIPILRVSLSSSTTYYLKSYVEYSAATPVVHGKILARRVR